MSALYDKHDEAPGDKDSHRELNEDEKSAFSQSFSNHFKSVGVAKSELLNEQCTNVVFRGIFLFTVFVVGFGYMLDANLRGYFTNYATGASGQSAMVSTVNVVSAVIAAGGQVVFARLVDSIDRIVVYIACLILYVVGTVIQSQASNVTRYVVGAVFYNLGYVGIVLILVIIVSDFSSLRFRLLYVIVPSLSYVVIAWISGNVLDAVGPLQHWSWGIGMWAFIFPLLNIPFLSCIGIMWWNARKLDSWKVLKGIRRKYVQQNGYINFINHLFWELDLAGVILMIVCIGCILVPLTLAGGYLSKWDTAHIIVPIVIGGVLMPVTILWERYVSKNPICPANYFYNRGVWPCLALSFMFMVVDMIEAEYLYQILIVAVNQSDLSASRISVLSSFVSTLTCFFYGFLTVYIRRLKPGMIFGTLVWLLGGGLMYHFRGGTSSKSGIIAAECIMGFGTGFFSDELTVIMQSHVSHEQMARVTAMGYVLYRIGGSVGSAVGGALWTQLAYPQLESSIGNSTIAQQFYDSPYVAIETYTWGTPERESVVYAYRHVQRIITIVGMCLTVLMITCAIIVKDRKLIAKQSYESDTDETVVNDEEANNLQVIQSSKL